MPVVQPPKERHTSQDDGSLLKIIIPSRKNYFAILFIGFWLTLWATGGIAVGGILIAFLISLMSGISEAGNGGTSFHSVPILFLLVWMSVWAVFGSYGVYVFLWQLFGKENIEVTTDAISIQRAIFDHGKKKGYLASHIQDLRVSPVFHDHDMLGWNRASELWGTSGGFLAFDYGSKTFHFGCGADEAEAKLILKKILARFPQYASHTPETN